MTRRYLLDTNAVSHLIYQRHGVDERAERELKRGARIGTCPPVVGELYQGAELSNDPERHAQAIRLGLKEIAIWPYGLAEAEEFGRIAAELRRKGRPMQVVDMQLAAVAFLLGSCTVVTTDSDLSAIPGLSVEDWTQPEQP